MSDTPGWEEAFDSLYQSHRNDEICGWEIALTEKRVVKEIERLRDTIERQQAVVDAAREVSKRHCKDADKFRDPRLRCLCNLCEALRALDGGGDE